MSGKKRTSARRDGLITEFRDIQAAAAESEKKSEYKAAAVMHRQAAGIAYELDERELALKYLKRAEMDERKQEARATLAAALMLRGLDGTGNGREGMYA